MSVDSEPGVVMLKARSSAAVRSSPEVAVVAGPWGSPRPNRCHSKLYFPQAFVRRPLQEFARSRMQPGPGSAKDAATVISEGACPVHCCAATSGGRRGQGLPNRPSRMQRDDGQPAPPACPTPTGLASKFDATKADAEEYFAAALASQRELTAHLKRLQQGKCWQRSNAAPPTLHPCPLPPGCIPPRCRAPSMRPQAWTPSCRFRSPRPPPSSWTPSGACPPGCASYRRSYRWFRRVCSDSRWVRVRPPGRRDWLQAAHARRSARRPTHSQMPAGTGSLVQRAHQREVVETPQLPHPPCRAAWCQTWPPAPPQQAKRQRPWQPLLQRRNTPAGGQGPPPSNSPKGTRGWLPSCGPATTWRPGRRRVVAWMLPWRPGATRC